MLCLTPDCNKEIGDGSESDDPDCNKLIEKIIAEHDKKQIGSLADEDFASAAFAIFFLKSLFLKSMTAAETFLTGAE